MQLTAMQLLIICPLVFLAGFVDAIAGGGGLISLPAYLLAGLPVHTAIATNKSSAFLGTTVATAKYAKSGCIPWRLALPCIPAALLGSSLGARLALALSDRYFKFVILFILPLTAFYVLRGTALVQPRPALPFGRTVLVSCAVAFVVGIYDGFYGPGTGVFLILLLTGAAHLELRQAGGMSKAINWATNVAALTVYLIDGAVLLPLGLTAGCFSILGNYLGARCFMKKGAGWVRPLMLAVLALFFIKLLTELIGT